MRQLLTEGLILSLLGGAAGLFLAFWATDILVASVVPKLPFMTIEFPSTPDWRVLAATLGFCLLSTFLFGFFPAWKLSQTDVNRELKEHGSDSNAVGGRSLFAPRNLVVIGQIALSLALLAAAGLFTRGALKAAKVDPGFTMENGLLAEIDASLGGYDETRGRQLYQGLLERLRALPGIRSAAMASVVPFGLFSEGTSVRKANAPTGTDSDTETGADKPVDVGAGLNIITTDYFKTLGLPLLRGREFDRLEVESATAAPVVIIDQALAEKLWPGEDPVGHFVQLEAQREKAPTTPAQIVGVVPTVRNDLTEKALQPHVYVPFGQQYRSQMNLHVKTTFGTPAAEAAFLKTLRAQIRSVDEGLPVISLQTMRDFRDGSLLLWFVQTGARLFGIFGGLALFLAVVGVYGVKSYVVAQRTREIGIRMAMGATKRGVVWMIVREGGKLTAAGLATGLLLALGVGRLLSSVLYDVHGADPLVFSITPLVLAAAAVLACYVPARRAARIQPMDALRHE
jgi:predicted permease